MTPRSDLVCQQCGQPDAHAVGEEILCSACYHVRGSCGAVPDPADPTNEPALKQEV